MVELEEALPKEPFLQGQGWDNPPAPEQDLSHFSETMPQEVDEAQDPTLSLSHHAPSLSQPRTKHPDITGRREASEVDGLGGHPLDGEASDRCWRERQDSGSAQSRRAQ